MTKDNTTWHKIRNSATLALHKYCNRYKCYTAVHIFVRNVGSHTPSEKYNTAGYQNITARNDDSSQQIQSWRRMCLCKIYSHLWALTFLESSARYFSLLRHLAELLRRGRGRRGVGPSRDLFSTFVNSFCVFISKEWKLYVDYSFKYKLLPLWQSTLSVNSKIKSIERLNNWVQEPYRILKGKK